MSEDVPDSSEGRLYAAETPGHMTLVIGDKYLTDSWQSFAYLSANLMTFVDFIAAHSVRTHAMNHYVTFTPDPDQDPDDTTVGELVFECDEPETAACRWTSDCDCEGWTVEHDDYGTFHTPIGYPGEDPGERERHDMIRSDVCMWMPWWENGGEEGFRESCDSDWPMREGRHEVAVTFWGDYIEVEYAEEAW